MTAWYLLAAETIDETMAEVLARKRGIVGAVTDGRRDESEAVIQSVVRALRGGVRAGACAWPSGFRPPGRTPASEPGPLGRCSPSASGSRW